MVYWATKALFLVLHASAPSAAPQDLQALDQFLTGQRPSELTGRPLPEPDQERDLRLLIFSHAYGSPERARQGSLLPASALQAKAGELAALKPDLVLSMGDFVFKFNPESLSATIPVFQELGAPVLNAVGNHEMSRREHYRERFGNTFGALRLNRSLLILLDTELDPWQISSEQLELLEGCLERLPSSGIDQVYLFAHKLIFCVDKPRYGPLLGRANAHDGWTGASNFRERVLPLLKRFAEHGRQVTWFGGDVGVPWSYGLFFDHDPEEGITYVCTGMGDREWDNVLELSLPREGAPVLRAIPLTDAALPALEDCGPAAWAERYPQWAKRLPKPKAH